MVLLEIILPIAGIVVSGVSYYVKKKKVKCTVPCINKEIDLTDETVIALEKMHLQIQSQLEDIKQQQQANREEGRNSVIINNADHKAILDMMKIMSKKAVD